MCQKCGNKKCGDGAKCKKSSAQDIASIQNELDEVRFILDEVAANTKFLKCGHPIIMLDNADDIGSFDSDSGLGSNCWEGWAICNGVQQSVPGSLTKKITPPNLLDKFIVGAGDTYDVGDTGGENFHTLTVEEMPAHAHALNDPGHLHAIDDDGHVHATSQDPHNHSFTGTPHGHTLTIAGVPDHEHATGFRIIGDGNGGSNFNCRDDGTSGNATSANGAHSHSGSADSVAAAGTVGNSSISIEVENAATGIEIQDAVTGMTMDETGGGEQHENRPPYFALIFVMKL